MPACSIVSCRARKNKDQPELTLHRFPKNERLRKKWLDSIGEKNISPRSKDWHICSLHFEEKCFNRTLDVIRLHENSVPTIFSTSNKKQLSESFVFCDTSNTQESDVSCTSTVIEEQSSLIKEPSTVIDESSTVMEAPLQLTHQIVGTVHKEVLQSGKIKAFKEKYVKQQKTIKRLNERIRRKDKKIADLKDIIKDLRRKNCINVEQAVVIEDLAGPKDLKGKLTSPKVYLYQINTPKKSESSH